MKNEHINNSYIKKVNDLDYLQKTAIYANYLSVMLKLKNDVVFVDKLQPNWNHLRGIPDKECLNIAFYYLWKNIPIMSFEEFISYDNIIVTDMGEHWESQGYAQRIRIDLRGIYHWYQFF